MYDQCLKVYVTSIICQLSDQSMSILQSLNINFIYIDEVLNQRLLQTSDIYFILQLEQEITRLERLLELPIEHLS